MAGWQTGCKVDTVAYSSLGCYSKVYGVGEEANIANEYASWGLLEDAPNLAISIVAIMDYYFRRRK